MENTATSTDYGSLNGAIPFTWHNPQNANIPDAKSRVVIDHTEGKVIAKHILDDFGITEVF